MTDDEAREILIHAHADGCYLPFDPMNLAHPVWQTLHDGTTRVILDDNYTVAQLLAILHFAPKP